MGVRDAVASSTKVATGVSINRKRGIRIGLDCDAAAKDVIKYDSGGC
jgi:hypothetical protein